jgi:hypothetical protein
MARLTKLLIAGSALLTMQSLLASAAESSNSSYGHERNDGQIDAIVINGQVNLGTIWSQLDTDLHDVHGDAGAAAAAVGNSAEIITFSDTQVESDQYNNGVIGSELNARVRGIGGDVGLTATSLCNGLTVSTDPRVTSVNSKQNCDAKDPSAYIDANVSHVAGSVGIQSSAVANQIEIDSNAPKFPITNQQINHGDVISNVRARISHIGGSASVSAAAAGNTAQIIQY